MRMIALILAPAALGGCTTTREMTAPGYRLVPGSTIALPRADVELGRISIGGVAQADADRTGRARAAIDVAVRSVMASRASGVAAVPPSGGLAEIEALHRTVATAIAIHKYGDAPLPTKRGRFDWTLGPGLRQLLGDGTHALFLTVRSYESDDGRKAMAVAGALGCIVGLCLLPGGGEHIAYASLVDLSTGDIVWFNVMTGGVGDPATPEGAAALVARLLGPIGGGR